MMRLLRTLLFAAVSAAMGALALTRVVWRSRISGRESVRPGGGLQKQRAGLKRWMVRITGVALVLMVGGFLVAASGIVPIKASSGHWAVTRWFLEFSSRRSVATHTIGDKVPNLDDPMLVLKGAGHYQTGCRPCHGSPDLPQPRIAQEMTPKPPYLPPVLHVWDPDELFYIVKHGIKFTGMPAWPSQVRDDEVWAMVAFLREMPELDAAEYRALVQGSNAAPGTSSPLEELVGPENVPAIVSENCVRCHGIDGMGRGLGAFPRLAGQRPSYLYAALRAYAGGERNSGIMEPVAAGLRDDEMREIARYYGRMPGLSPLPRDTAPASQTRAGETIALQGIPAQGVPSCADCHGAAGDTRNPFYPVLAGQYADYLILQLELFKDERRGGSAYAHLMHPVASRLTMEQMRDVALYFESLPHAPDAAGVAGGP